MDLSAPNILRPWVRVPSTTTTLFQLSFKNCIINLSSYCKKEGNKQKSPGLTHLKNFFKLWGDQTFEISEDLEIRRKLVGPDRQREVGGGEGGLVRGRQNQSGFPQHWRVLGNQSDASRPLSCLNTFSRDISGLFCTSLFIFPIKNLFKPLPKWVQINFQNLSLPLTVLFGF